MNNANLIIDIMFTIFTVDLMLTTLSKEHARGASAVHVRRTGVVQGGALHERLQLRGGVGAGGAGVHDPHEHRHVRGGEDPQVHGAPVVLLVGTGVGSLQVPGLNGVARPVLNGGEVVLRGAEGDVGDLGALVGVGGLFGLEVGLLAVGTAAGLVDVLGGGEQAPDGVAQLVLAVLVHGPDAPPGHVRGDAPVRGAVDLPRGPGAGGRAGGGRRGGRGGGGGRGLLAAAGGHGQAYGRPR